MKNPNSSYLQVVNSLFFVDLAQAYSKSQVATCILSPNFIYQTQSTASLLSILAILDLPYKSMNHKTESSGGRGVEITPSTNIIMYQKEVIEAESELDNNLLVIHRYYENGHKESEKKITEFLSNSVYGCQVIVTNVSSKE